MDIQQSAVGSVLRATQAFCQQLCEKQTLQHGIAFSSDRFPYLPEANQFREVVCENAAALTPAFEEAERFFRDRSLTCYRWAPAMGQAPQHLSDFLTCRGFERKTFVALVLSDWVEIPPAGNIRVVHARALRAAFRQTFHDQRPAPSSGLPDSRRARDMLADAYTERLDDPQFDMFVALMDKKPAGRGALYQVGDIARIMDLTVLQPFAGDGVDRALIAHLLALAKRLAIRRIYHQVEYADTAGRELCHAVGFTPGGTITEFHRPTTRLS